VNETGQPSPEDSLRTIQELHLYQTELEMQNEELQRAHVELESVRARYFDLYDLAPVGYVTISEKGLVLEANLTVSTLLGMARSALVNQPFSRFILKEDQDLFYVQRRQLFADGGPQAYELRMMRADGTPVSVRLRTTVANGTDGTRVCRAVMSDITGQKQAEQALQASKARVHAQLDAILLPEGDVGALELVEILDLPVIQRVMADFYSVTGIGACILDLQGEFLFATDWEEVCAKFHRAHPEAVRHCRESDTVLSRGVAPGAWKTYRCKNNMREVVTPICVGGKHLGNLFLGRFLFDDEPLDYEGLRGQALRYGFDEREYIAAHERMPRFSREKIGAAARFYMHALEMVVGLSHGNLRLARAMAEREQLLDSLRASEEKFRIIANHTANLELWFAPDGHCVWVNPVVWHVTGYSVEEIMEMSLSQFIETIVDGEDRSMFAGHAREALEGSRVPDFEFRYVHRNGVARWGNTSWQPVRDAQGNFLGIRASGRDIHERKLAEADRERLEAQLLQSQKMEAVGQLAGGVAHDFNNLLHVILGYTNILRGRLGEKSEDRHAIEQVHRAAERAADLTRQLLAFSRRQIIQPVALDLNSLIQGVLKMVRAAVGAHIDLLFMPGPRLGVVRADRGQLEQVLMNLSVNARDAMPNGGTLTIDTKNVAFDGAWCLENPWAAPGRYVQFSVADTGCGMDAETCAQIFEPFFTTKEVGQGTGLGLAMVYGIVKHHGGLIHVDSAPGKGATFSVYLPAADQPADTAVTAVRTAGDGGTETVLVAEDDEMVRELVRSILEAAGYTVLMACDGDDAARLVDEHANAIDLALLDVMMPRGGGRAVMDHIRTASPRTRVLFSSAYGESAIHLNFVIKEGLSLLVKPYSRAELLHAVREALGTPGK
jgi:PAS domain S-box-containing protein